MVENQGTVGQRIFWLGMHKILVNTELPRLRKLGYEVFNPPYLSSIQDQSACLEWDANQSTTLPADVFKKLSNYNFFYNSISKEIADLLNNYFTAVIVTISPAWLSEVLKCYKGKIIYRVYGQHYLISHELANNKILHEIVSRDNFWFVPHAAEAVNEEESWLRDRKVIVPYCLTDDIFEFSDTWGTTFPKWPKIALTCPNISNPYFQAHYRFLKENFSESFYRYYGVQLSTIDDPQVVGTLSRKELLNSFQKSAGYLYTYTEERVCYLPPIEMMVIGGPVLYLKGSLLDRYFNYNSPGRCVSLKEAREKTKLLIQEDKVFIDEIIASQKEVRERYSPEYVWPKFDGVFDQILKQENKASSWLSIGRDIIAQDKKRIYIFHHFPGDPIISRDGIYTAYDGIPRVVRQVTRILAAIPDIEIFITARASQVASMNGYFRSDENFNRIRILCMEPEQVAHHVDVTRGLLHRGSARFLKNSKILIRMIAKKIVKNPRYRSSLRFYMGEIFKVLRYTKKQVKDVLQRELPYIDLINKDANCLAVFVPHYYWFPDALKITKKIVLYLPDYMPHFFHETGEFSMTEGKHTLIGRKLSQKAEAIFCNSNFTKSYLPDCRLKVAPGKIHVSYLPFLNTVAKNNVNSNDLTECDKRIGLKPYIFYPTRPHPNKNLGLLLRVFDRLVNEGFDIYLVLTTVLGCDAKSMGIFNAMKNKERVIFLDTVTDDILASLYRNAAALCFTSLAEGNFPPQIHEALKYDTPIVAGRLGFITERIPDHLKDAIIFCEPNNEDEFVAGCKLALNNREFVLEKQQELLQVIEAENVNACFRDKVLEIFNLN